MPKTKIVCTIGPASRSEEILRQMIERGANVFRLNFSHGTHDEHREVMQRVRRLADELHRPVAILQDLSGPKIRLGKIANDPIFVNQGDLFLLTTRDIVGNQHEASVTYEGLASDVHVNDEILLADGTVRMKVVSIDDQDVSCIVEVGGMLASHKGLNLPGRQLNVNSMTDKDREDMAFGVREGVDFIALSFVRSAGDVREARRELKSLHSDLPIIAKIEKHEALECIEEIIEVSDAIMVARGDLGVEIPLERVPLVQKRIIDACNLAGKPVITATQMLLSMMKNVRPTRAEAADVANAILDGSDAIMMSDETAMGAHPVLALDTMMSIALDVETGFPYDRWHDRFTHQEQNTTEALSQAACRLAEELEASCIACFTQLGGTPQVVSKFRPPCKILALTPLVKTFRRLTLTWGVRPVLLDRVGDTDTMVPRASQLARQYGLAKEGERVVITGGVPVGISGSTNSLTVYTVLSDAEEPGETLFGGYGRRFMKKMRKP